MKLRLIYPRFKKLLEDHPRLRQLLKEHIVGDYTMPPSLALPTIAALTPDEIEVGLTDDNIFQDIDYNEDVDLVVISCFTPQAQRAYEIADQFRANGKKVILGGLHPTCAPDEAAQHADSVCVGEVEGIWLDVLDDLKNGQLKARYEASEPFDMAKYPIPKRDIFKREVYKWNAHLVLTMRGCPIRCCACPVPVKEQFRFRFRPVDDIIEDIKSMPYKEFYFTDDQIMLPGKRNRAFIEEIAEKTKDLDISIFLSSTMKMMGVEPELYKKLKEGKTESMYTVFGYDDVSLELFSKDCSRERWQNCVDTVKAIEDAGIHFFASYGIGFDGQDKELFDNIIKFSEEAGVDLAEFVIATPFPGTPFGIQCEEEGRILHRRYNEWNQANVVFKPKNFTEQELLDGYFYCWEEFFKNKKVEDSVRSFDLVKEIDTTTYKSR